MKKVTRKKKRDSENSEEERQNYAKKRTKKERISKIEKEEDKDEETFWDFFDPSQIFEISNPHPKILGLPPIGRTSYRVGGRDGKAVLAVQWQNFLLNSTISQVDFRRCDCCPFGFHIDLDFVDFASSEVLDIRGKTLEQRRKIIESDSVVPKEDKMHKIRRPKSKTHEELDRQMLEALRTEEYYKSLLANECKDDDDEDNGSLVFMNNSNSNNDRFNQSFNGFSSIANNHTAPERSPSVFSDKLENLSANHNPINAGMTTFLSDSLENLMSDFDETLARSSVLSNYANLNENKLNVSENSGDNFNNSRKFSSDLDKNNNNFDINALPVRSSSVAAYYDSREKTKNSSKNENDTVLSPKLAKRKIDLDRATLVDPVSSEDKFAFFDQKMDMYISPNDLNHHNNQTSFYSTLPKQQPSSSSTTNSKTFDYNKNNKAAQMDNSTRKENTDYVNMTAKIAANMEQVSNRLKRLNSPEFSQANYKAGAIFVDKNKNSPHDQENAALERLKRLEQDIKNRPPLIENKIFQENVQNMRHNTAQSNDLLKIKTSGENFRDKLSYYETIGGAKVANGHTPETPKRTYSHDRMRDYQIPNGRNLVGPPPPSARPASVTPYVQKFVYPSLFPPENQNISQSSSSSTGQLKSPQLFHSLNRFVAKQANNFSNDAIYRRTPPVTTKSTTQETKYSRSGNDEYVSDSEIALGDKYLTSSPSNFGDRRFSARYSSLRRPRLSQNYRQATNSREDFSRKKNFDVYGSIKREQTEDFSENYANFRRAMDDLNENYRKFDQSRDIQEQKPNLELIVTKHVGGLDEVEKPPPCIVCSKNAAKTFKSSGCYTGPLSDPKPCTDCENLKRKLQLAEFKPVVFDVSTSVPLCTCTTCLKMRAKVFIDRSTSPAPKPSPVTRGVMAELPTKSDTCEHCTEMRRKTFVGFGVNTDPKNVSSLETGTDFVEFANRQTNTETVKKRCIGTNTEPTSIRNVASAIDKSIFCRLGYLNEKSTNTNQTMVINVGFNTDPWNPEMDIDQSESQQNLKTKSDAFVQVDIARSSSSSIGVDANQFTPSKTLSKDNSSNTQKLPPASATKNVAVCTDVLSPRKTKDRSVDCRATCCDASMNTSSDTDDRIIRLSSNRGDDRDRNDANFEAIRQNLAVFETAKNNLGSKLKIVDAENEVEGESKNETKPDSPSTNDETGYSISSPDVDDDRSTYDKEYMISSLIVEKDFEIEDKNDSQRDDDGDANVEFISAKLTYTT
uniref:Uncharacterized protein n=1 Tax=Romanomermis culicivorax TaxID=13658 RepID=A0A915JZQ7_ROMCU